MTHYETLADRNTSEGIHQLFIYVVDIVPIFLPLVLTSFFLIVALGGFFSEQRLNGKSDFSMWFAIAGYVTTGAVLILSLIPNLVDTYIVVVAIVVSIIGTLWLFISRG